MSYLQRVKSFMEGVGMLLAILILMLSDESGASWVRMARSAPWISPCRREYKWVKE